ncbi:hypothetical protein [Dethiobacter alkaliphilus]|uniref:hypothetical protein n=1 Tax=Dethiobacter alkaliphilus TaxID=427926 RepID=UPI002227A370|nr:hypothetical protein [Dethiobacter alkaliphilus]MCW3490380.1 hypothetical protein [Dethiobacter alkaliphilus]
MARLLDGEINFLIMLAAISVWTVNRNLNGDRRIFEIVPVSRQFIFFNVYLAVVMAAMAGFLALWFLGLFITGIFFAITYIVQPQNISQVMPETFAPTVNIEQSLFMFLLIVIILVVGSTISFVRNNKYRSGGYLLFFTILYGLLSVLKNYLPPLPDTGRVVFMESLSYMPWVNELLTALSIVTAIIVPLSIYIGYRLYLSPQQKIAALQQTRTE